MKKALVCLSKGVLAATVLFFPIIMTFAYIGFMVFIVKFFWELF